VIEAQEGASTAIVKAYWSPRRNGANGSILVRATEPRLGAFWMRQYDIHPDCRCAGHGARGAGPVAILGVYKGEQGQLPYHPGMLVALLLYGYSRGVYSSRQLARACEERVDVMAVTGLKRPTSAPSATFRKAAPGCAVGSFRGRCCGCVDRGFGQVGARGRSTAPSCAPTPAGTRR